MSAWLELPFFGLALTLLAYWLGVILQQKTKSVLCNPMVVAIVLIIAFLSLTNIPYESYYAGANFINLMLLPGTACLGVSIYHKRALLHRYWLPVLVGCVVGAGVAVGSIYLLCQLFGLERDMMMSLLPKSATTPIAVAISESNGGLVPITVAAVIAAGVQGNFTAPMLIKLLRIRERMAAGLAIGACSHGLGTAKAIELGDTEGAMSGLATGMCGILTSILALGFGFL